MAALEHAKTTKEMLGARGKLKHVDETDGERMWGFVKDKAKDGRKRFMVLEALCDRMPPDEAADAASVAFSGDADDYFRVSCALWMGKSKHNRCRQALQDVLARAGEKGMVQVGAAAGLAAMGDASGKERALQAVLESESWADIGMFALEKLRAKDVIPLLETRLGSSTEYFVRNHCRLAILRIKVADSSKGGQIRLLHAALLEDGFFHVRKWAGLRLGIIGSRSARDVLLDVARNPKAPGRHAAGKGLLMGIEKGHWTREDVRAWLD